MKVTFTARHFTASDDLKEYAINSVVKLNKYFDHISSVEIILEPTQEVTKPQSAEIKVSVPGTLLTTSQESKTYEQAVHDAIDNLSRQLRRYKEKRFSKH